LTNSRAGRPAAAGDGASGAAERRAGTLWKAAEAEGVTERGRDLWRRGVFAGRTEASRAEGRVRLTRRMVEGGIARQCGLELGLIGSDLASLVD
jgi:hypothetical protein